MGQSSPTGLLFFATQHRSDNIVEFIMRRWLCIVVSEAMAAT
jgi:hypothetical protein